VSAWQLFRAPFCEASFRQTCTWATIFPCAFSKLAPLRPHSSLRVSRSRCPHRGSRFNQHLRDSSLHYRHLCQLSEIPARQMDLPVNHREALTPKSSHTQFTCRHLCPLKTSQANRVDL
jgi:hypothetical protein